MCGRTHGSTDQACDVKILLANLEPSTHGPTRKSPYVRLRSAIRHVTDSGSVRKFVSILTTPAQVCSSFRPPGFTVARLRSLGALTGFAVVLD
jgi:hypothetical protein